MKQWTTSHYQLFNKTKNLEIYLLQNILNYLNICHMRIFDIQRKICQLLIGNLQYNFWNIISLIFQYLNIWTCLSVYFDASSLVISWKGCQGITISICSYPNISPLQMPVLLSFSPSFLSHQLQDTKPHQDTALHYL